MKTMKLGIETGSLINHMMSGSKTLPVVGKGATVTGWSDRHPYFVDEVSKDGKSVVIQQAEAKRVDKNGMSESQEYEYSRGGYPKENLRFRYGQWYIDHGKDAYQRYSKINIVFGVMEKYWDPTF